MATDPFTTLPFPVINPVTGTSDSAKLAVRRLSSNIEALLDFLPLAPATSPPANGTFTQGQWLINSNAVQGDPFGWYCVAGGTPGTWVPLGILTIPATPSPSPAPAPTPTPVPTPPPANFTVTIISPAANDKLSGTAQFVAIAPAMLNVELKDSRSVLLFQGTPNANGNVSGNFDVNALASGPQTLTAYAWDSAAGTAFTHSATDTVDVTVVTNSTTTPPALTTPTPISGLNYNLVKNWTFGSNRGDGRQTITNTTDLLTEFYPNLWYYGATNVNNYAIQTDNLVLKLTRSGATIREATMASKWSGKFGYFECRWRCTNITGSWPAFWLYPNLLDITNGTNGAEANTNEMDINETFNNGGFTPGGGADTFYSSNRAVTSFLKTGHSLQHQHSETIDTTAYLKHALLWTSDGTVKTYINDTLVDTYSFGSWTDANPMVILDIWHLKGGGDQGGGAFGSATSIADGATSNYEIDYVRVWQP
jgi:hypothetical protein